MISLLKKIVSFKFGIMLLMVLLLLYRTYSYYNSNAIKESTSLDRQNGYIYISKELNNESDLKELKITSEETFIEDGLIVYDYHHSIQFNGDNDKKNNYTIRNFLDVDVHYPQVVGLKDKSIETNLNKKLKMLSLNIISADYEDILLKYKSIIDWKINKNNESILAVNGKYKILSMDNKQISVHVYTDFYEGVNIFYDEYVMTIDINSGNIKKLNDIVDMDHIERAIKNTRYQIISGETSELANFMSDERDEFNKKILAVYQESKKRYADKEWEYGVDLGVTNINNFGIDKDYLYINLLYDDALNGFLILKIPISELNLK